MEKELNEIIAELGKLEARASEIHASAETADAETLASMNDELTKNEARRAELEAKKAEIEQRMAEAKAIEDGKVEPEEIVIPKEKENRNMPIKRNSFEYRDAFLAYLSNTATAEQRAALITTDNGVALPQEMDDQIWDNIHTEHPILADIDMKNTGVVLTVRKHTAITAGKAKKVAEGAANADEENTFVNVTLSGNDYSKDVELSYAEAKMTQGALESYLVSEISADLGEVIAKDVFAQIGTDAATKLTTGAVGALTFKELTKALGSVKGTGITIYASRSQKFEKIVGMVDTAGQPIFRDGVALGAMVKEDEAAGDLIYVVAPKMFVENVVQGIMIESDRDIKAHKIIYSGYARMQGTLRDVRAAAVVTIKTA